MTKIIVVTGASSGIGEAIAKKLAKNEYQVVLVARNKERLEKITKEINETSNHRASYYQVDVSNRDQVEKMVSHVQQNTGDIYGYINNAGLMLDSVVKNGDIDSWDQMIDVNIKGVLYGTSLVIPQMVENAAGHIVNIASVSGHEVTKKSTVYSATKFAVRAISQGLEKELAKTGVRITNISPGMVDTSLVAEFKQIDRQLLEAEDIANGVLYALEQPSYVNVNELTIRPS